MMDENMLSMMSNGGNDVSTEGSDSSGVIYPVPPSTPVQHGGNEPLKKFKGLVPMQNGNWGAQIYADNHRVWLGTFKSETEAAMAYDSAAIKLRCGDSYRNFPWTSVSVEEPNFQSQFSKEVVLNMIKDGSYQPKFVEFLSSRYKIVDAGNGLDPPMMLKRGVFSCKQLFQKELTPSDVGKLNRLVIPKRDAVAYFPNISERTAVAGQMASTQLDFFDPMMRSWKFRYCYWKSSQSFVFTRGWNRFVKDKQLKANDVISFYLCESKEEGKVVETFFMIDFITRSEDSGSSIESDDQNAGLEPGEKPQLRLDDGEEKVEGEIRETDPASNVERKGFRLFGVEIN